MIFSDGVQLRVCGCPTWTTCNCAATKRLTANEQARIAVQKGITREYLRILNHLKR